MPSDKKSSGNGLSAMAAISASSRRLRNVSVSLGLSVISPVTSLRAIHISSTSTRNALGKRMAWLWPLVKTLAVVFDDNYLGRLTTTMLAG